MSWFGNRVRVHSDSYITTCTNNKKRSLPEVQKKAQAELDRVVGPSRLPDFGDLENLTYVKAVVLETTRWMPTVPLGVPHLLCQDDVYRGYLIPKGTLAIPVRCCSQVITIL